MVDKNRVEGAVESTIGKVEDAVGRIAGDASTQAEGKGRQAAGAAQSAVGETADTARRVAEWIGEITKEQPFWTLLAVGAISFVLGRFSVNTGRARV